MAQCKLPCAVFIDRKIAHQTSFLTIYSIIFYGKELTCHEAMDLLVCFNQLPHSLACNKAAILHIMWYLYIYLELACHDEQNGSLSFNLQARISELWRFKAWKLGKDEEDDRLVVFKPGLWRTGFFGCGEEWYHFKQKLMISKTIFKLFS